VIRRVESVQHAKAGYCHEITRPLPMVDAATKLAMRGIIRRAASLVQASSFLRGRRMERRCVSQGASARLFAGTGLARPWAGQTEA